VVPGPDSRGAIDLPHGTRDSRVPAAPPHPGRTGPVRVEREGPDALIGTAGTTLADPLVIRVLDGNGAPIPRVAVVMPGNPIGEGFTDSIRFCHFGSNPGCGGNSVRTYRHVGYTNADGVVASRFTLPMQAP
jgi:hypothetical protein